MPDPSILYFYLQDVIIEALLSEDEQLDYKAMEIQANKK